MVPLPNNLEKGNTNTTQSLGFFLYGAENELCALTWGDQLLRCRIFFLQQIGPHKPSWHHCHSASCWSRGGLFVELISIAPSFLCMGTWWMALPPLAHLWATPVACVPKCDHQKEDNKCMRSNLLDVVITSSNNTPNCCMSMVSPKGIRTLLGSTLNCSAAPFAVMTRKHYFVCLI